MGIRQYLSELYNLPKVVFSLKVRMIKVETVVNALIYGCSSTWTLAQEQLPKLRTVHHRVLLCIIGAQCKRPEHLMISYSRALETAGCESIETTLRTRRRIRMSGGWLPKRIMSGKLEGAVRRGRSGKEKEWADCGLSDSRACGIAGNWEATASEADVWIETVT